MGEKTLKQATFDGMIWNYITRFGNQIINIIPAMILARLLTPDEYGVIAISSVFVGFLTIFSESGFPMALVQKNNVTDTDINSVFYFNILISCILYLLLYFTSPIIAAFFNIEELTVIIRVASFGIIITSFGSVQNTLFVKELEYKKLSIASLLSSLISCVVGIVLAYSGKSYWSLVFQSLSLLSCQSLIYWLLSRWRPSFLFSFKSLKNLFGYGSKVFLTQITNFGFNKVYDIVIGKMYKTSELSYFNKAISTQNMVSDSFLGVLNNVAFPAFSKMQTDKERLRTNVIRFLLMEFMITSFVMLLVIAMAKPIFHFLYSSRWDAAIPLFQIICIWSIFKPVSTILSNGLLSVGLSGICLRNGIISRVLNIAFLICTWKFGLAAMMAGQVLAYLIECALCFGSFNMEFKYSSFSFLKDVMPLTILSIFSCACVYVSNLLLCKLVFIDNEFIYSLVQIIVSIPIGFVVFLMLHKKYKLFPFMDFSSIIIESTRKYTNLNRLIVKVFPERQCIDHY